MGLNERISKVIEYSKLTPSEFADEVDVQRSSISHITSGRNKPSLEFIIKIKSRFPEILWDWLVNGEGEMLKSELPENSDPDLEPEPEEVIAEEKTKPTPLSDLFSMMNEEEDFRLDEPVIEQPVQTPRESVIPPRTEDATKISDSQRLAPVNEEIISQVIEKQTSKIKRIVLFYENGKFESFEP
ncbi:MULTISPECIES: helix-turn-helix domain-containing protein [Chryseobacterium]|uniref:DNA-binding XRE family transcriptional regulator n=1 Tax=Chryseobacterium camelliae TaxID=1265445 RepID=A0ABU0TGZ2_9FLAO|nr:MULTISPECIES: helix-turn-helix transcriptional regulator [Chryseobacterium]MDT3405865.1 DNA-binding XRE family transcriptional regulator [Pseudacidovorax intermedius]MDQ1096330.1 DNA-binding XRE family transcriptional regulator [Chryseobacterium camelliae]MDQ1100269.1 DNA-binding XRE family transcriptional regulator [Chryseobacterium sp. SORGH_AS_1048]MDR6087612.1 DNA-binding XRE family transcriptional regulator [Chryseobacterium sp. SORGH_AS_0909]MDR6131986.1 DNA-binding XRE family transcr